RVRSTLGSQHFRTPGSVNPGFGQPWVRSTLGSVTLGGLCLRARPVMRRSWAESVRHAGHSTLGHRSIRAREHRELRAYKLPLPPAAQCRVRRSALRSWRILAPPDTRSRVRTWPRTNNAATARPSRCVAGLRAPLHSLKKQAARWPSPTVKSGGWRTGHGSNAWAQRAQNAQPGGNIEGEGTRPAMAARRLRGFCGSGKAASSAFVYGCEARLNTSR